MNQYKIFKHPSGDIEAVKQGWSWPAFFAGFVWAMFKKMWWIGIGGMLALLVIGAAIGVTEGGESDDLTINLIGIIVNILFGVYGNPWREKNLVSRGFTQKQTVSAANPNAAVALYKGELSA